MVAKCCIKDLGTNCLYVVSVHELINHISLSKGQAYVGVIKSYSLCKTYFSHYRTSLVMAEKESDQEMGTAISCITKPLDNHGGLLSSTQPWRAFEFYTTMEGS